MLSSIIVISSRSGLSVRDESIRRSAAACLGLSGYTLAGWSVVPDEERPIAAAIERHIHALGCALIVTLDAGCETVRARTISATLGVSDFMLSTGSHVACGLVRDAIIISLPCHSLSSIGNLSALLDSLHASPMIDAARA